MKHGKHIQVSESFLLCALLTMTGGFLDVYTYITRGHVFANAQTGNVVLLGLNLAEGNIKEVAFYLFPIIAFAMGILFTEWIRAKFKEYDLLHWRQIVVFFEALLLFFPAFMSSGMWDTAVNILVSFVCAVQVESFRKVNGHSVATTMCTGNLRSATEQIFHYVRTRDPDTRKTILSYYEIVVFFALGATLGAALSALFAEKAILFCCLFLIIAFLSMFAKEDMSAKNHSQAMWKRECVSVYRTFRVRTRRPGNPGFSCSFHIPYGNKKQARHPQGRRACLRHCFRQYRHAGRGTPLFPDTYVYLPASPYP